MTLFNYLIIRICDKCENQFDSNSNQIFRKQLSYVFLSLSFSMCVRLFTLFVCLFVFLSLEKTLEICLNEIGFLKWFFLYRILFDLCNGYCTMFPWIEQFQLKNKDVKFNNTSYSWKCIGKIWLLMVVLPIYDITDSWRLITIFI